eukprot:m.60006 g.60006  ORF g.60006 m.60006 type:complete len:170 (-) comp6997_c0_seq1:104-613(-)
MAQRAAPSPKTAKSAGPGPSRTLPKQWAAARSGLEQSLRGKNPARLLTKTLGAVLDSMATFEKYYARADTLLLCRAEARCISELAVHILLRFPQDTPGSSHHEIFQNLLARLSGRIPAESFGALKDVWATTSDKIHASPRAIAARKDPSDLPRLVWDLITIVEELLDFK